MNARIYSALLATLVASTSLHAQDIVVPSETEGTPVPLQLPTVVDAPFVRVPASDTITPASVTPTVQGTGGAVTYETGSRIRHRPTFQAFQGLCGQGCATRGGACADQWWVTGEYWLGIQQGMRLPALVTTSPAGTPQGQAGILGQPGTLVLFGGQHVNDDFRNGYRLEVGRWFSTDSDRPTGIQAGFKFMAANSSRFNRNSQGDPILARPFGDAVANVQDAALVAFPGLANGSISIGAELDSFFDFHIDLRETFHECNNWRWDSLIGYRFLRQNERLDISQSVSPQGGVIVPGTTIVSSDLFETANDFHGVEVGLIGEWHTERGTFEILAKVAAGQLQRRINIAGSTTTTVPGAAPTTDVGGLLALNTNIGERHLTEYIAVPEFGLTWKYQVSSNATLRVGYNFLFMSDMARVGEQIDTVINPNRIPPANTTGPNRPQFVFGRGDYWMHAFNAGLTLKF